MNTRWAKKNMMMTGSMNSTEPPSIRFHSTRWNGWNCEQSHGDSVQSVRVVCPTYSSGVEEVVPGVQELEQRDRGDRRLGQRHDHPPQDLELAGAVHARRIRQLLRDGQEELAQQEDREGVAEEAG